MGAGASLGVGQLDSRAIQDRFKKSLEDGDRNTLVKDTAKFKQELRKHHSGTSFASPSAVDKRGKMSKSASFTPLQYLSAQHLDGVIHCNNEMDANDAHIDVTSQHNLKLISRNYQLQQSFLRKNSQNNMVKRGASSQSLQSKDYTYSIPELERETSNNSDFGQFVNSDDYDDYGDSQKSGTTRTLRSNSTSSSYFGSTTQNENNSSSYSEKFENIKLPPARYDSINSNISGNSKTTSSPLGLFSPATSDKDSPKVQVAERKTMGDYKSLRIQVEDNSTVETTHSSKSALSEAGNSPNNLKSSLESSTSSYDMSTISVKGTFHIGRWKINNRGLLPKTTDLRENDDEMVTQTLLALSDEFVEVGALGNGASAMVVEALHIPTLTIVALKMLPVDSPDQRLFFKSELEVLYKNLEELKLVNNRLEDSSNDLTTIEEDIDHTDNCRYIVKFYNAFVNPRSGMINLVLEYMDGGSLEDLIQRGGSQDETSVADIAYQTLKGIKYIHKNNFIHRDIKPSNILMSTNGRVKIADFGIATVFDETRAFANTFVGTVCYMSPERLLAKAYSSSADVWSFGLTMLAVSEGRFPLHRKQADANPFADDKTQQSHKLHGDSMSKVEIESKVDGIESKGDGLDVKNDLKAIGGYWGMISAICDDELPVPGHMFSQKYNAFIKRCLVREAAGRASAGALLQDDFIVCNRPTDRDHWDPRSDRNSLDNTPVSNKTPLSKEISAAKARRGSRDKVPSIDTVLLHQSQQNHNNLNNSSFDLSSPPKTPHINSARDVINSSRSEHEISEEELNLTRVKYEQLDRLVRKVHKFAEFSRLQRTSSDNDIYDEPVVTIQNEDSIDTKYEDPSEGKYDEFLEESLKKADLATSGSSNGPAQGGSSTRRHSILPSFNEVAKWKNLCQQLDLPLAGVEAYVNNYFEKVSNS